MINFEFSNTTEIVFGKGTENQTGEKVRKYSDCDKALLVYGSDRIKRNGLFDTVCGSLKAQDIQVLELGGVKPNPRLGCMGLLSGEGDSEGNADDSRCLHHSGSRKRGQLKFRHHQ